MLKTGLGTNLCGKTLFYNSTANANVSGRHETMTSLWASFLNFNNRVVASAFSLKGLISASNTLCSTRFRAEQLHFISNLQRFFVVCARAHVCIYVLSNVTVHPGGSQQRDKGAGRFPSLLWFLNPSILTSTLICESVQSLSKQLVPSPPK